MWTNNGRKLLNRQFIGDGGSYTNTFTIDYIDSQGNTVTVPYNYTVDNYQAPILTDYNINNALANNNAYRFILFCGTGTTEPTVDDYTLANPVTMKLVATPSLINNEDDLGGLLTFVLQNNTGSEQTITEIGLGAATSETPYMPILFNRRLLENPVTMQNGETYAFSFAWNTSNLAE